MNEPLIKLSHVSKYYKTKTGVSEGMRDINLEFFNNEFVAITGESGSGKTTLLNVISGLDTYEDGELFYEGKETSHFTVKDFEKFRARNIGFVFQNYNVIDSYTVYDNVEIALIAQNYPEKEIKARATKLIEQVGLLSHINQRTSKLSGGQKQRVVIARALAKDAPIILADEPTGNLDEQSSDEILTLLKEISKERLVIMVSHNMKEVDKFATRKIIMSDGNIKNDIVIEKTVPVKANLNEDNSNKNGFKKGLSIAFKNIIRTPKRSFFTLLLSSIVLFAFVYFYSTLVVNVIGSVTGALSSNPKIALVKRDETKFTKEEYASIKTSKTILKYFDVEFNQIDNSPDDFIGDEWERDIYSFGLQASLFDNSIIEGRRPVDKYEVLTFRYSEKYENKIGDVFKIKGIEFSVSGIVENDYNSNFIVYSSKNLYLHESFIYDADFNLSAEAKPFLRNEKVNFSNLVVSGIDRQEIKLYKSNVDEEKFQIIDTDLIVEKQMEFIIGTLKLMMWVVLFGILNIVFLVIYQIQKNVMESRKKDFSVYRSIGVSEQEVSFMILFEQLIIAVAAAVIVVSLLAILSGQIQFIYKITRNVTFWNYLLIILVFVLFSLRLGQKFNKKIFDLTVIEALKEDN